MNFSSLIRQVRSRLSGSCPHDHPDHELVRLQDDALAPLKLPRGSVLHVDRSRTPRNGDLVWVELVRQESKERLVRRYSRHEGLVTLTVPAGDQPAIMRRSYEVAVLGVVDRRRSATCQLRSPRARPLPAPGQPVRIDPPTTRLAALILGMARGRRSGSAARRLDGRAVLQRRPAGPAGVARSRREGSPALAAGILWRCGGSAAGVALLLLACTGGPAVVPRQPRTEDPSARPPWRFDTVASAGLPGGAMPFSGFWGVRADNDAPSPPHVLCENGAAAFAALSLGDAIYTDVALSARLKLVPERTSQTAGLIFRVQDKDNYYILGLDSLAGRIALSRYAGGRLSDIKDGPASVMTDQWLQLRLEARGNRLQGFLNGQLVVDGIDDTYTTGRVGLWTKADSVACFDDVDATAP